jgi:membrane-bound lytic murein transglycosylase D
MHLSGTNVAVWLPSTEYDTMRRYFYRLTHERRELTQKVLDRAEKYMAVVQDGIRVHGLPPEVACLPLVESAFEPQAVSPAGAAGLWQLMPATARRYGLTVTNEVDERFDVQKSTAAAAAYLASLFKLFGDWPLALAAYNCGEGAMQKALGQSGCSSLEDLILYCRQVETSPLKEETLRFVPQFAAAVLLMHQTGKPGSPAPRFTDSVAFPPPSAQDRTPGGLSLSGSYTKKETIVPAPPRSVRLR